MAITISGDTGLSGNSGALTAGTAQASTSGTSIDFTGIPSWVKRITVMFSGVSTNGASNLLIQIGTSGGLQTSGYTSGSANVLNANNTSAATHTTGFGLNAASAANNLLGAMVITNITGNVWVAHGVFSITTTPASVQTGGSVTLSGTLDRVRITTVNGTDTFDAGTINIMYE